MATKASATKKPVKRAATKTTAKKAPAKRPVAKRSTKKASAAEMRSFRLYKDTIPFTRAQVTRQTVYWVILLAVIVAMQLWIIKLQLEIAQLTELLLVP